MRRRPPSDQPDKPWHHGVYEDIGHWDDERLEDTYRRLTEDLWLAGRKDLEHYRRMMTVSMEMDRRGIGHRCDEIARDVQRELEEREE